MIRPTSISNSFRFAATFAAMLVGMASESGALAQETEANADAIYRTAQSTGNKDGWEVGMEKLESLAEEGDGQAQYYLAKMYNRAISPIAQNRDKAKFWYRRSAESGNGKAQLWMGRHEIYKKKPLGQDLDHSKVDYSAVARWYKLAAENGVVDAQASLGELYEKGLGIPINYELARKWYEKAVDGGSAFAVTDLAYLYQQGLGVGVDYKRALEVLIDAGKGSDDPWVRMIQPTVKCAGVTELFGQPLKCIHRSNLDPAVRRAGLEPIRVDGKYWADVYDSSEVLANSTQLQLTYTQDNFLALAVYTFPSDVDVSQIDRVQNLVASKYGNHDQSTGNTSVGEASFTWLMPDGVRIEVSRGWPNTSTKVSYYIPLLFDQLLKELEAQRSNTADENTDAL